MKLRRLALLSLALLLVLSGLSFSCPFAKAEQKWTPGNLSWNLSADGTLTITAMDPNARNNYMSDFDEDCPAPWLIDDEGHDVRDKIKKVVLGPGVRNCGEYAFEYCSNLTSVEMDADSVELIACRAFRGCTKLTTVKFSVNLEVILPCAFEGCTGLTSVTLPFWITTSITTLGFYSGGIKEKAFDGSGLKHVYFVGYEDEKALISIDSDNKTLNSAAWHFISSTIRLPDHITTVENNVFAGTSADAYVIPEGVTSIQAGSFSSIQNYFRVYLPESVTFIDNNAFAGNSLYFIICPSNTCYAYRWANQRHLRVKVK